MGHDPMQHDRINRAALTLVKTLLRTLAAGLVVAGSAAVPAHAQFAGNSRAPIVIDADTADYQPGVTLLRGQVDVRQDDVRILSDQMKIFSSDTSAGSGPTDGIERIEADGNFYYITPDQEVKGTRGVYLATDETFTVTGDVILLQGENVVSGDRLIYDLTTEEARVVGTCQGRRCGGQGRVRILIKQDGAAAPDVGTPDAVAPAAASPAIATPSVVTPGGAS